MAFLPIPFRVVIPYAGDHQLSAVGFQRRKGEPAERVGEAAVRRTFDKDIGAGYRMAAIGHRTRYLLLCIAEAVA